MVIAAEGEMLALSHIVFSDGLYESVIGAYPILPRGYNHEPENVDNASSGAE